MEERKVEAIYSNNVNIKISTYDVIMTFALANSDEIVALNRIYMSPQHAKAFSVLLSQNVEAYERAFGIINIEPDPDVAKELAAAAEE